MPTEVHLVKAMVFPVVMYGWESWTIKKAERRRIDAFELWSWKRLLRVPWTARRSNQSILKEIGPEYSIEGLMLKLKFQYFGHLMWRTDSLQKILMVGKIEGWRRRGQQRMRLLGDITDVMDMSLIRLWVWTGRPGVLQSTGSQRVKHDQATKPNWTEGIRIRCNSVNIFFWNIIDYNIIPQWLSGKESACNAGDASSIPGSLRFPWRREWQPTPVFLAEKNPMDTGVWWANSPWSHRVRHDLSTRWQQWYIRIMNSTLYSI